MNSIKYDEWSSHYDPFNLEMRCLKNCGINFERKRVLEIGSGTGRFTKRILQFCEEITCIDPDPGALNILKESLPSTKIQIICGTLESVDLKTDYYDYVVFPWSLYLIHNQNEVLSLSKKYLKLDGCVIVLQAMSGEYEEEIANLYNSYNPLKSYDLACKTIPALIADVFEHVRTTTLTTFFEFDSINQTIDCSLFFIEDEEGKLPKEEAITSLRKRLQAYLTNDGKVVMSDIVSVIIASKEESNQKMDEHGLLRVGLKTQQSGDCIVFSCSIQNIGNKEIGLNNTYLFVDQGVYNSKNQSYEFPFLQKKYLGIAGIADEDCIGCALCRNGIAEYPKDVSHINEFYKESGITPFYACYPLHHLSSKSILYMSPKETFTEELVVTLKPGVYRAILMCVPDQNTCDCMCSNKCFCVNSREE